ncbi:hypothetical protein OUZ56_025963 [Daphnia magna]|uniref:Uncharacterized protein n=1 Tax=Daphnia magna TaxID=35525 RepID=A0ABQ9ZKG8_9CRUS|nr:hypothetical protein OUZ56_025946 [Daphnia magna]KAK4013413.1 hypothetical protein OUZ56_025963 [Daphnia magna]
MEVDAELQRMEDLEMNSPGASVTTMGDLLKKKLVVKEADTVVRMAAPIRQEKKIRILSPNRVPRRQQPVLLSGKEGSEVDYINDADTASSMRAITSLVDLFAAFELKKSSSLRKLLSAADVRSNISNWEEESKANHVMQISVAKIYKSFISKIAVLLCGPAAQVSITKSMAKLIDQSRHVLTLPLIHTIARSKKAKTEQRTARAYLCGSHRREDVVQLKDLDGDFTLATHTFQKGLKDFKTVTSGQCLPRINWSIGRFNHTTADSAI